MSIKEMCLDYDKTIQTFEKNKNMFERGQCYKNVVLSMALLFKDEFEKGKYKVGYGYVGGLDELFVRHCYIVTDEDRVIDTSAMFRYSNDALEEEVKNRHIKYFTFATLAKAEFLNKLELSCNNLDLKTSLEKEERICYEFLLKNNFKVHEVVFSEYLQRFK